MRLALFALLVCSTAYAEKPLCYERKGQYMIITGSDEGGRKFIERWNDVVWKGWADDQWRRRCVENEVTHFLATRKFHIWVGDERAMAKFRQATNRVKCFEVSPEI